MKEAPEFIPESELMPPTLLDDGSPGAFLRLSLERNLQRAGLPQNLSIFFIPAIVEESPVAQAEYASVPASTMKPRIDTYLMPFQTWFDRARIKREREDKAYLHSLVAGRDGNAQGGEPDSFGRRPETESPAAFSLVERVGSLVEAARGTIYDSSKKLDASGRDLYRRGEEFIKTPRTFEAVVSQFSQLPQRSKELLKTILTAETTDNRSEVQGTHSVDGVISRVAENLRYFGNQIYLYLQENPDVIADIEARSETALRRVARRTDFELALMWDNMKTHPVRSAGYLGATLGGAAIVIACSAPAPTYAQQTPDSSGRNGHVDPPATPTQIPPETMHPIESPTHVEATGTPSPAPTPDNIKALELPAIGGGGGDEGQGITDETDIRKNISAYLGSSSSIARTVAFGQYGDNGVNVIGQLDSTSNDPTIENQFVYFHQLKGDFVAWRFPDSKEFFPGSEPRIDDDGRPVLSVGSKMLDKTTRPFDVAQLTGDQTLTNARVVQARYEINVREDASTEAKSITKVVNGGWAQLLEFKVNPDKSVWLHLRLADDTIGWSRMESGFFEISDVDQEAIRKAVLEQPTPEPTITPEAVHQLPELKVGSGGFVEADGKPIQLKGAVAIHFMFEEQRWLKYSWFGPDIRILKENGATLLIVPFDVGRIDDPAYRTTLLNGLQEARSLGFRIDLVAGTRGSKKVGTNMIPNGLQVVDNQLDADWSRFVRYPDVADALRRLVDIITPDGEPGFNSADAQAKAYYDLTMPQWAPRAERICADVNAQIGANINCGVSGVFLAKDTQGVKLGPGSIAVINVYPAIPESFDKLKEVVDAGRPVMVGEMGFTVKPSELEWYRSIVIPYLQEHRISFAGYGAARTGDDKNFIDGKGNLTPIGQIIVDAFKK